MAIDLDPDRNHKERCHSCRGEGKFLLIRRKHPKEVNGWKDCDVCYGTGFVETDITDAQRIEDLERAVIDLREIVERLANGG